MECPPGKKWEGRTGRGRSRQERPLWGSLRARRSFCVVPVGASRSWASLQPFCSSQTLHSSCPGQGALTSSEPTIPAAVGNRPEGDSGAPGPLTTSFGALAQTGSQPDPGEQNDTQRLGVHGHSSLSPALGQGLGWAAQASAHTGRKKSKEEKPSGQPSQRPREGQPPASEVTQPPRAEPGLRPRTSESRAYVLLTPGCEPVRKQRLGDGREERLSPPTP